MWEFDASLGCRLETFTAASTLPDVVERIAHRMKVLCVHSDPCGLDSRYIRAIWCVDVRCEVLFDQFFNSWNGYRAAFFRSSGEGRAANEATVETLARLLLQDPPPRDKVDAARSLAVPSAKVWLTESDKRPRPECPGKWKAPSSVKTEIYNGRWELCTHTYATYGRRAPLLRTLRVFGGFVSAEGREFVPPDKERRAIDIGRWGWS